MGILRKLGDTAIDWLTWEKDNGPLPHHNYERLKHEIQPCDVLLIEGRSRVSEVIKMITNSIWTHTALYIGRLSDIEDPELRQKIQETYNVVPRDKLILEALLGEGTIISPLRKYKNDHVRIARPHGITNEDMDKVIAFALQHLGRGYNLRQMLDMARFFFPYSILPRRWRSSLFEHRVGETTQLVCSSLIAAAFSSVNFPILPIRKIEDDGTMRLYKRNIKLFTPSDFDLSPYFWILKYPYPGLSDLPVYRQLPWGLNGFIIHEEAEIVTNTGNSCAGRPLIQEPTEEMFDEDIKK